MKSWRSLLTVIILSLFPASSSAIDFYAGVKGGLGLSGFWGAGAADSAGMKGTVQAGFCGGAFGSAHFNDLIACQLEFLYALKGKNSRGYYTAGSMEKQWNMHCLEIPLLAKLTFPLKNATPHVYAGPSLGFPLSSTYRVTTHAYDPGGASSDTTFDLKASTSVFDIGLAIGGGMDIGIETGAVIFDLRFTPGFVSWDRRAGQDKKNFSIAFMIGYAYKF